MHGPLLERRMMALEEIDMTKIHINERNEMLIRRPMGNYAFRSWDEWIIKRYNANVASLQLFLNERMLYLSDGMVDPTTLFPTSPFSLKQLRAAYLLLHKEAHLPRTCSTTPQNQHTTNTDNYHCHSTDSLPRNSHGRQEYLPLLVITTHNRSTQTVTTLRQGALLPFTKMPPHYDNYRCHFTFTSFTLPRTFSRLSRLSLPRSLITISITILTSTTVI